MIEGWEIKKLGEICEISTGNANTEDAVENGEFAFFDRSKVIKRSSSYLFDCDAIIIAGEGATFLPKFYSGKFNLHQRAYAIFNFNNDVDIQYANKYLIYFHKYFEQVAVGATVKSLRLRHFQDLPIPLPTLPEQQRIVAILDEAFAAITKAKANAEQNLKNAKELFESYLQAVFENKGEDWEERTLGEVLVKTETVDPTKKPNEEFIYLDVSSVNKETKEIENPTVLLGKDAPSRARKLVRTNDIIFATVRPTHSRVALITEEYDEQVCSTGYFVLRAKAFLNSNLLYYFLLTYNFNKQMEKLQKGASYPAVTDSEVKGVYILFPKSIKEQHQIVQKLDALSTETQKLETIYRQKINDLEELKKSILQKAFSGQLQTATTLV